LRTVQIFLYGRDALIDAAFLVEPATLRGDVQFRDNLRSLHVTPAFIGSDVFRLLCVRCVMLEEISVSVGIESLVRSKIHLASRASQLDACLQLMFKNLASSMKSLHTARFDVRNIKQSRLAIEIPRAAEIIEKPQTPALRRLSVNHVYWEVSEWMWNPFSCR